MAKGISLHLGLNYVDPEHYSGWDGKLNACEFDAHDMALITSSQGFEAHKLLRSEATRDNVIASIHDVSQTLSSGDFFVISYSGHGGQVPDVNSDEVDGLDETWCLFDGQLLDDELHNLWSSFQRGVRILVISDSCHSGTVVKVAKGDAHIYSDYVPRLMNHEIASNTYLLNKGFYDEIGSKAKGEAKQQIQASVKLISGCQDNQLSYDGPFNGQFTSSLKRVWNGGNFKGNYSLFHKSISNILPAYQSPNYMTIGEANLAFDKQSPFLIG